MVQVILQMSLSLDVLPGGEGGGTNQVVSKVFSGLSYLCQKYQCDVSSSRYVGGDAVGLMMVRVDRNRGCINVPMIFGSYSFHPLHSCHIYYSKR